MYNCNHERATKERCVVVKMNTHIPGAKSVCPREVTTELWSEVGEEVDLLCLYSGSEWIWL